MERLERRLAQQEKALEGFHAKVEKQQALGHAVQEIGRTWTACSRRPAKRWNEPVGMR